MHLPLWIELRVNDTDMLIRRFRRDKLTSIEYMGYDADHALADYQKRIEFQMKKYAFC